MILHFHHHALDHLNSKQRPNKTTRHLINLIVVLLIQIVHLNQDDNVCVGQGATSKQPYYGTLIGKLNRRGHDVSGDVYAVDEQTLFIKNFNYDGQAPDAYFWSSVTSPLPSPDGFIVPDEKGSTKPLERYINKDVVLRLPEGKTLREIRWISIWCRQMKLNFGELAITRNLVIPQPIEISPLSQLAHGIRSGHITIIDAQTFLVPEFSYDGLGPAGYFWLTRGPLGLSANGLRLKDENGSAAPLRKYNGETVVVSLPEDYTIYDFDFFGVWCKEFQVNFGQTKIPQTAKVPPSPKMLGIKPENKLNCEILYDDLGYEIRWVLDGDDIVMQLVGKIEPGEYMAFGLGKDDARSDMNNADATVTWVDRSSGQVHAVDYFLSTREQCVGNRGSCPDVKFNGGSDSLTLLHGAIVNGYSMVTFKRPQLGIDELYDQHVYSDGQQSIIWAIGPLNDRNEIAYHRLKTRGDTFIDFARTPQWNCPNPDLNATINHQPIPAASQSEPTISAAPSQQSSTINSKPKNDRTQVSSPTSTSSVSTQQESNLSTVPSIIPNQNHDHHRHHTDHASSQLNHSAQLKSTRQQAWSIPPIVCPADQKFVAQIGPTGGQGKGYQAITGHIGWGITWYINGLMIPELVVQRGKTYKFIVEGGSDKTSSVRRHPLYITDSPEGGFDYKTDLERRNERIFAGVGVRTDGQIVPTATGRLCEWKTNGSSSRMPDDFEDFDSFKTTLRLECDPGQASMLKWTPDSNTPDIVYYQCYTHRYLGWRIRVVDSCDSLNGLSRMDLDVASSNLRLANRSEFYIRRSQQPDVMQFGGPTNNVFAFEQNPYIVSESNPNNTYISNSSNKTLLAANNIAPDITASALNDVLSQSNFEFLDSGMKNGDPTGNFIDSPSLLLANAQQYNQMMVDQSQSRPKLSTTTQGLQSYISKLAQLHYPTTHLSSLSSLLHPSRTLQAQQQQSASNNLKPASMPFSLSQLVSRSKIDLISPVMKIPRLRLKSSRKYESMNKPSQPGQPPTPATEFNYDIFNNHIAYLTNQQKLGHAPWPAGFPSAITGAESNFYENLSTFANTVEPLNDGDTSMGAGTYKMNDGQLAYPSANNNIHEQKQQHNSRLTAQNNRDQQQQAPQKYGSPLTQSSSISSSETYLNPDKKFSQEHLLNNQAIGYVLSAYNTPYGANGQQQTTDVKSASTSIGPPSTMGSHAMGYVEHGSVGMGSSQSDKSGQYPVENQIGLSGLEKVKSNDPMNYQQADSIIHDTFSILGYKTPFSHMNQTKPFVSHINSFKVSNLPSNIMGPKSAHISHELFNHQHLTSNRQNNPFIQLNGDQNQIELSPQLHQQKHLPLLMNSLFNNAPNKHQVSKHNPSIAKPSLTKLWFTSSPFRGTSGMSIMQQAASNLGGHHVNSYQHMAPSLFLRQRPQQFPYSTNPALAGFSKLPFPFSSMLMTNSNEHHTNHIALPQLHQSSHLQSTAANQNHETSTFQSGPQLQTLGDGQILPLSFGINEPQHVQQQVVDNNYHYHHDHSKKVPILHQQQPHMDKQITAHQVVNNHPDSGGTGGADYMMAVERFSKQSSERRPPSIINPVSGKQIILQSDDNKFLHNLRQEIEDHRVITDKGTDAHSPYYSMDSANSTNQPQNYQQIANENENHVSSEIIRVALPKQLEADYPSMMTILNVSVPHGESDQLFTATQQQQYYSATGPIQNEISTNGTSSHNDLVIPVASIIKPNHRTGNVPNITTTKTTPSSDGNLNSTLMTASQFESQPIVMRSTLKDAPPKSQYNQITGTLSQPTTESVLMSSMVLPTPINFFHDSSTTPSMNNTHYNPYYSSNSGPLIPIDRPTVPPSSFFGYRQPLRSVLRHSTRPQPPVKVASIIASHISDSASIKNFLSSSPTSSPTGEGNIVVLDSIPIEATTSQAKLRPKYIGRFVTPTNSLTLISSIHPQNAPNNIDDKYKIFGHQFDRLSSLSSLPSTSIALDPMIAAPSIPSIVSGQMTNFVSPTMRTSPTTLLIRQPKIIYSNGDDKRILSNSKQMMNLLQDFTVENSQKYTKNDNFKFNSNNNNYNHKLMDDHIFTKYIPSLISSTARPTIATYYIKDNMLIDNKNGRIYENYTSTNHKLPQEIISKSSSSFDNSHQTIRVPQIPLPHPEKEVNYSITLPTSDNETDHTILSHVLSLISTNAVAPPVISVSSPQSRMWSDNFNQRFDLIDFEINRRRR